MSSRVKVIVVRTDCFSFRFKLADSKSDWQNETLCVQLAGKRKTVMLDETMKGIATHVTFSNSHVARPYLSIVSSAGKPSGQSMGDGQLEKSV